MPRQWFHRHRHHLEVPTLTVHLLRSTFGTFRTFRANIRRIHELLLGTVLRCRAGRHTAGIRMSSTGRGGCRSCRRTVGGRCPSRQHGSPLCLQSLDYLQLLHVLGTEDVSAQCAAQLVARQFTGGGSSAAASAASAAAAASANDAAAAVLVALGRTEGGRIHKLNGWRILGTLRKHKYSKLEMVL